MYQLNQSFPDDSECYVYFYSNWCPDCTRSTPAVKAVCVGEGQRLLTVNVGERDSWKDPSNPLRAQPWAIKCLPSLIFLPSWTGEPGAKLDSDLEQAPNATRAAELVSTFFAEVPYRFFILRAKAT